MYTVGVTDMWMQNVLFLPFYLIQVCKTPFLYVLTA